MSKGRILIVEDDGITSMALRDVLESFDYQVIAAVASGEEAIPEAKQSQPDLILMDINLQGAMDGIAAAEEVWKQQSIPVVFLTAYADEETLSRAKLVKPFGFILKPFKDLELNATIQIALANFEEFQKQTEGTQPVTVSSEGFNEITDCDIQQSDVCSFLKRIDPFRKLPAQLLNDFSGQCSFQEYKNNEYLVYEGDELSSCYIVEAGRVALIKSSIAGKELTVALLPPGDIFGVAITLDESKSAYSLLAHGDTRVLALSIDGLKYALAECPHLYRELHEELSERVQRSHAFSLRLAHDRVEVRIAAALIELASDFGKSQIGESSQIVTITRQQLSQIAGTTPETTIRATRAMEENNILDLSKPGIIKILKFEQLEELSAGA